MFKTKPICELCGKNEATSFSFFVDDSKSYSSNWKFVCECTADNERYAILIQRFFSNPSSTVDWMAHMHEKDWMDWNNFMDMMTRFRAATDSYGQP